MAKTRKIKRVATRKKKDSTEKARAARAAARKRRKRSEYSDEDVGEKSSMSADSEDEFVIANNGVNHRSERKLKGKRIKVEARASEDEDPTFDPNLGDDMIHTDFLYPDVKVEAKEEGDKEERVSGVGGGGAQKSARQGGYMDSMFLHILHKCRMSIFNMILHATPSN